MPGGAVATPRAPFDAWPPAQAFDARFGYAWWTDPATLVFQAAIDHGTVPCVEAVQGWIDSALAARAREIKQSRGLLLFYDVRALASFESNAMRLHLARMQARPRDYLRASVVIIERPPPMLHMALHTANLVASRVANAKVELTSDVDAALRTYGVRPPGPGQTFPPGAPSPLSRRSWGSLPAAAAPRAWPLPLASGGGCASLPAAAPRSRRAAALRARAPAPHSRRAAAPSLPEGRCASLRGAATPRCRRPLRLSAGGRRTSARATAAPRGARRRVPRRAVKW